MREPVEDEDRQTEYNPEVNSTQDTCWYDDRECEEWREQEERTW